MSMLNPSRDRPELPQTKVYWQYFDRERTRQTGGDHRILINNLVALSLRAGLTDREALEQMASTAYQPFALRTLSEVLAEKKFLRGRVYCGYAGDQIDKIVANYRDMRWWMSQEGLVVGIVPPQEGPLSEFDRLAGRLFMAEATGRLPKAALLKIAQALDRAKCGLKENLQPAQWKPISLHNQKHSKAGKVIRTFADAAANPRLSQFVRRRLYVARDRYKHARRPISSDC